jgi:hypothetical protein
LHFGRTQEGSHFKPKPSTGVAVAGSQKVKGKGGKFVQHPYVNSATDEIKAISRSQGFELVHQTKAEGKILFRCARSSTYSKSEKAKRSRSIAAKATKESSTTEAGSKARPDTTLQDYNCHGEALVVVCLERIVTATIDGALEVTWAEPCTIDGLTATTKGYRTGSFCIKHTQGSQISPVSQQQSRLACFLMHIASLIMHSAYLCTLHMCIASH